MSPLPPLRPRPRPFGLGWYWTGWVGVALALFVGFMAFSFAADAVAGPSSAPASAPAAEAPIAGDPVSTAAAAVTALQHRNWALGTLYCVLVLVWVVRHKVAWRVAWLRSRKAIAVMAALPTVLSQAAGDLCAGLQLDIPMLVASIVGTAVTLWPSGSTTNGPPAGPDPSQPQPPSATAPASK